MSRFLIASQGRSPVRNWRFWPIASLFCRFVLLPFNKTRNFAKFGCARGAGSVTPSVTPCQPPRAPTRWPPPKKSLQKRPFLFQHGTSKKPFHPKHEMDCKRFFINSFLIIGNPGGGGGCRRIPQKKSRIFFFPKTDLDHLGGSKITPGA